MFGKEKGFGLFGNLATSSLLSAGKETLFTSTNIFSTSSITRLGIERGFASQGTMSLTRFVSSAFQVYGGQQFSYVISAVSSVSSSVSKAAENFFSVTSSATTSDISLFGQEHFYSSTGIVNVLFLKQPGLELGFLQFEQQRLLGFTSFSGQFAGNEYSYIITSVSNLFSSVTKGTETFYSTTNQMSISAIISSMSKELLFSNSGILSIIHGLGATGEMQLYPPGLLPPVTISLYPAIQPSGILNLQPILTVENYMPSLVSSLRAVYTFLFTLSYPAHINVVCVAPQTSTVNVDVVTIVTVPDLNYSVVLKHTLNGNQSVTEDVTVPLPLLGQAIYAYHVSTTYMYGNTLIGQSNTDGTLTMQTWYIWLWAGIITALALTVIGLVVGGYVLRKRRIRNKLKFQKTQNQVRTQQRTIQRLQ
jgi:hypothetical protein